MKSSRRILQKFSYQQKSGFSYREGYIPSAVLVIFTINDNKLCLVFTHRTKKVRNHKDQVSFPGGVKQKGDADLIETAIRETQEEIGMQFSRGDVISQLPEILSTYSFQIIPFVVYRKNLEEIKINKDEVLRVFTIPYDRLADSDNWAYEDLLTSEGIKRLIVFNTYEGEKLWGLTAQIVLDLVNIVNE